MSRSLLRRLTAVAATASLALGVAGTVASPAQAADPGPAPDATAWLASKLTNGLLTYPSFGSDYTDVGLTIDAGLAFAATGRTADVATLKTSVAGQVNGYAFGDESGTPASYAPQIAKVMVWAEVAGANPRDYGGYNLVAKLEGLTRDSGPAAGRIASDSTYGDYSNTLGQALAARGLSVAASPEAANAVTFLLKQQCAAGFFRDSFTADPAAAEQSCVAGDAASKPSVDATAYAALMLQVVPDPTPAITESLTKAKAWLRSVRAADGSFASGDGVPNANSTGLAAAALAASDCTDAGPSANWVKGLQVPSGATGALGAEKGAVAFDKTALDAAAGGIAPATLGQWLRSTAQAAPGLLATVSPTLTSVTGPTGFVKAGSTATLTLTGLSVGDNVCFAPQGGEPQLLKATAATVTTSVKLPATTADTTYTVSYAGGEKSVTVKGLAALKAKATLKKKVKTGKKQKVRLTGFAPSEPVKVKAKGKVVAKGKANAAGVFKAKFKVRKSWLKKKQAKAKIKVKARGAFADRGVVKKFKVTR